MSNKRILSITGSISNSNNSYSAVMNMELMKKLQEKYPSGEFTFIDLNNTEFAQHSLNANNMSTFFENTNSDEMINRLKETDLLVLSASMTNFNYSSVVKNFLDAICVANKTFSYKYSKKGDAIGLLDNLEVVIITAQGAPEGWYPWGDHNKMLQGTFGFLGAKKIHSLRIDGTKVAPLKDLTPSEVVLQREDELNQLVSIL